MKVVIDTNILIDSQTDEYSFANRILEEVLEGRIQAFANRATVDENHRLVKSKVRDQNHLTKLQRYFKTLKPALNLKNRVEESVDPDDNKILESAQACRADYIISSDKHLLDLGSFEGSTILPPSGFWAMYEDSAATGWKNWIKQFIQ